MCGIVGYLGPQEAYPILIDGLKRLEYRGYDSAGIATLESQDKLRIEKKQGKVANLEAHVGENKPQGTVGIGHTRWATHGPPSDVNAHPHAGGQGRIAVIHNGIIENFREPFENCSPTAATLLGHRDRHRSARPLHRRPEPAQAWTCPMPFATALKEACGRLRPGRD